MDPEERAECSEMLEDPLFTQDSFHIRSTGWHRSSQFYQKFSQNIIVMILKQYSLIEYIRYLCTFSLKQS